MHDRLVIAAGVKLELIPLVTNVRPTRRTAVNSPDCSPICR